jgi:hypothetical protein
VSPPGGVAVVVTRWAVAEFRHSADAARQ